MRRALYMIWLLVVGLAWGQYFEPPPMDPDPSAIAPNTSPERDGAVVDNSKPVPREVTRVAVLGYHNFSETKPVSEMLIRTSEFRRQMEYIRKAGLRVISMQEFLDWKLGNLRLPAQCVLITLDDGWRGVYTEAFPILREFGFPFTLFLYTKYISGRGDSMTPDMIREMQQHGASIGSHSTSHLFPREWKAIEAQGEEAFSKLMDTEMGNSFKRLSELFGPINTYCYPGGYITDAMLERLPSYGYVAAFTVVAGKETVQNNALHIHRYMVFGNNSSIFRRAVDFSSRRERVRRDDSLGPGTTSLPPFPVFPAANSTADENLPLISAKLGSLPGIDLSSVKMRVSGFGLVPAKIDTTSGSVQWSPSMRLYQSKVVVQLSWKCTDGKSNTSSWSFFPKPLLPTDQNHTNAGQ